MLGFWKALLLNDLTEEQKNAVWRFAIAAIICSHWFIVYDAVPGFETGFAKMETVNKLQVTIERVQQNQLLEAIEKERRNVCLHLKEDNKAALDYAVRKRNELMREYMELSGRAVEDVTCKELGVS